MEGNTIVVIRFDGRFEIDAEGNWGYIGGRTKARLIHTKCTYNELLEIAFEAMDINPKHFQLKMKFRVRSCYKLDLIKIENDGSVFLRSIFVLIQFMHPHYLLRLNRYIKRRQKLGKKIMMV